MFFHLQVHLDSWTSTLRATGYVYEQGGGASLTHKLTSKELNNEIKNIFPWAPYKKHLKDPWRSFKLHMADNGFIS